MRPRLPGVIGNLVRHLLCEIGPVLLVVRRCGLRVLIRLRVAMGGLVLVLVIVVGGSLLVAMVIRGLRKRGLLFVAMRVWGVLMRLGGLVGVVMVLGGSLLVYRGIGILLYRVDVYLRVVLGIGRSGYPNHQLYRLHVP